jgi:hypothetical protein
LLAISNDVAIKFLSQAGSKGDLRGPPCAATQRQDLPGRNLVDVKPWFRMAAHGGLPLPPGTQD